MSRRGLTIAGLGVAGIGGYYLYSAGGDPKIAETKAEADMAEANRKMRREAPGREAEAEKKAELLAKQAGRQLDSAVAEAKQTISEADAKAERYARDAKAQADKLMKETGKDLNHSIDNFDKTVERKTVEAKRGISSWLGFGGSSK